jgi:hypothetical protein
MILQTSGLADHIANFTPPEIPLNPFLKLTTPLTTRTAMPAIGFKIQQLAERKNYYRPMNW